MPKRLRINPGDVAVALPLDSSVATSAERDLLLFCDSAAKVLRYNNYKGRHLRISISHVTVKVTNCSFKKIIATRPGIKLFLDIPSMQNTKIVGFHSVQLLPEGEPPPNEAFITCSL